MTDDPISRILRRDQRYSRQAYDFVREALQETLAAIGEVRHVTAEELLEGIRSYAHEQFGPLTRTVLNDWGIHTTKDFGTVVFNLVEEGEMGKTEEDDIADFVEVYSFDDVFPEDAGDVQVEPVDEEEI